MEICDIIIPTTFNPQLTYECIESILSHNMGCDYQITVVDNGSDPKFENTFGEKIKVIRVEEKLGFARSMNLGIKSTNDEYVLLLNNDTQIEHNNFLLNFIETINSQENIGIVSPMTNFIGTDAARCQRIGDLPNKVFEFKGHIAAVCWFIKRNTFDKIGMFDENYLIGAFEDGDFCENALRNNYKIFIDGRNFLFHHGSRSVSQTPGYVESFHKNHIYFKQKWGFQ